MARSQTTKKANRPSTYKKRPPGLDSYTCNMALNIVARKVEIIKANNGGVAPYGAVSSIVSEMKPTLPWLNIEMVRSHLKKLNKQKSKQATALLECVKASPGAAVVGVGSTNYGDSSHSSTLTVDSTFPVDSPIDIGDSTTRTTTNPTGTCKLGGRPAGSTTSNKRELDTRLKLATAEAARVYKFTMDQHRSDTDNEKAMCRLSKGALTRIIDNAKTKYNVPSCTTISASTIRSRFKRNNVNPATPQGTPSPMAVVEPYLVSVILQRAKMRCPINVTTGLQLANSMIEGTTIAKAVLKWKMKHNAQMRLKHRRNAQQTPEEALPAAVSVVSTGTTTSRTPDEDEAEAVTPCVISATSGTVEPLLGLGYWIGFMKRHSDVIRSKRSVKFESKRAEWCTYENFSTMYDEIYKQMAKRGIASEVNRKLLLNKEGEIVEHPHEAFGLPTEYVMQRPDKLLFVDEVGSNTSTTKDGNVGGEKYLCEVEGRPQVKAATRDSHFTVLGFTAATGEPVMCAVIFAAKQLCASWVLGFNAAAEWIGDKRNMRGNTGGLDKRYPCGPVCNFNGKQIPTFCCCSENGSITAELLVAMLSKLDKSEVFDRSDGIPPFLLLDGHGSRFELKFLQYINNEETKWNICIGLPYGTSYWQVGDSSEQNGCFKMALTRYKRELLRRKELVDADFAIQKEDITYIVSQAWADSFARVSTNKKAIAERGWGPLNYNCLLHPEIAATRHRGQASGADSMHTTGTPEVQDSDAHDNVLNQLNLTQGLAGSLIDDIVDARNRDDARNGVNREAIRQKRIASALEVLASKRQKYSAGLHAASCQFMVGPDVLDNIEERERVQEDKVSEREERKLREYRALRTKVSAIKGLNKSHEQLTVAQLKVMVMWYKSNGDSPTPTTRPLLLRRLQETCGRSDPPEPPLPSLPRSAPQSEQLHHAALREEDPREQSEVMSEF